MQAQLSEKLQEILHEYVAKIKSIYEGKLAKVILYGSYARGDYTPESDIDIMILVEGGDEEARKNNNALASMTYEFDMQHDVYVESSARSLRHFNYWRKAYPFYKNVHNEGVVLYEST